MEEILNKIKEVYQDCVNLKNELTGRLAQAAETEKQQKSLADDLTALQKSLVLREEKVKEIEDLVRYRKENETIVKKATEVLAELETKTKNFSKTVEDNNKEIQARKEASDIREKKLSEKEAKLEDIILGKVKEILKK